ncbi:MAG TPA: serine/threonine-protein kinase, partial [Longimicrobiales bacterium]|nr:serine/threonine-protein kinase [Longimicrobiales bacterium]
MTSFFGKYQVVEIVGEGGFGKVFKGYDPTLKRYVAIKTCTLRHADIRARFTREAEIAANLRHPNIVTVYDFGEHEGEPYLVQEFLSGEDLDRIIKRADPVDVQTKVRYLSQLAEGLAFAHRYGVVHRDVKPGNVRIQTDGQVRIMDFGIAKLLEADQQLTQTGLSVGTTGYLAPEQLKGQDIDHRADIFSYGVLAYELVAGRRPFEGESITSIFYKIAHEEPAPVTELAPGCPPRLAAIIDRCLKKNREERFAHLGLVKDELDLVAAELKTGVGAPTIAAAGGPAGASAAFSAAATAPAAPNGTPAQATAAATAPAAAAPAGSAATAPARASRWRTYGGLAVAAAAVAIFAVFSVARWGRGSAGPEGATAGGGAAAPSGASRVAGASAPAGPATGAPQAPATGPMAPAGEAGAGAAGPATPAMSSAAGSPGTAPASAAPAGAAATASAP